MIKIGDASGNVRATYWKKQGIEILGDTVKIFGTVNQMKEIKVLGLKKINEAENDCHTLSVELYKQIRMLKEEMKEGEQEEMKEDVREEMRQQMRIELEEEIEKEKNEMKKQIMEKMKKEIKEEMRNEIKKNVKENVVATKKKDENVDDDKVENGLGKSKNIDENRNNRKDKKIDENKNVEG